MTGTLYIVSTPLGNLEDVTLRALRILKEADLIAAEDTRHSLKLLTHFGIKKPLISYWGEKEKLKAAETIQRLKEGRNVALISDAGTPGISDPGTLLIQKAIEEGIAVVPVPGPSAVIAALSLSGFCTREFTFFGFLPARPGQRKKMLSQICREQRTLVFYEAPHRLLASMADLADVMGDRPAVVIKELTKYHEEVLRGTVSDIGKRLEQSTIAGEYVIVLQGRPETATLNMDDALAEMRELMRAGRSRRDAARSVADAYGLSKKELYDRSLEGN